MSKKVPNRRPSDYATPVKEVSYFNHVFYGLKQAVRDSLKDDRRTELKVEREAVSAPPKPKPDTSPWGVVNAVDRLELQQLCDDGNRLVSANGMMREEIYKLWSAMADAYGAADVKAMRKAHTALMDATDPAIVRNHERSEASWLRYNAWMARFVAWKKVQA